MLFNRKKKISIIGAGNAGCISALHYAYYGRDEYEITLYHDPELTIERVGQGTLPKIAYLLFLTLGLDWYSNNPIDATLKTGFVYEGWSKKENYFSDFGFNGAALHYVPQKLSNVVLESGLVKVVEKKVEDLEREVDGDFIMDCRGRHNKNEDDYEPLINPLNSVLLCNKPGFDSKLHYTRTVATPNGWTFVVPNIDSVSYGYLYNNTITTKEEATKDFIERFGIPFIDGEFTFKNYIAKNVFVGERTMLNGNRCGFLEPLDSTALQFYQYCCRFYYDYMQGTKDRLECNTGIRKEMYRLQNFILWHYKTASNFDTPFWKYAKSLPFKPDDHFRYLLKKSRGMSGFDCRYYADQNQEDSHAQWNIWQFYGWDRYTS